MLLNGTYLFLQSINAPVQPTHLYKKRHLHKTLSLSSAQENCEVANQEDLHVVLGIHPHDRSQKRLVAARNFSAGDPVIRITGNVVDEPKRHTIQIGKCSHLEPLEEEINGIHRGNGNECVSRGSPPTQAHEIPTLSRLWMYLNHCCGSKSASLRFDASSLTFFALRDIDKGGELTFDYTTTEYSMESSFECFCGSPECIRNIKGFAHLSLQQKHERIVAGVVSYYLLK